ncbi:hypothetical protein O1611_g505 [Lasiodiplodia mahajangana]|uniref:Uncharacterized protein n=1 Tax=Lasiodiplodia mahajangana TaxID=1108764 RepID=A0ACC2K012_9PEZI|nr:hypothetical protein O1611_g505 [Lasiodiplodia mahajangana]
MRRVYSLPESMLDMHQTEDEAIQLRWTFPDRYIRDERLEINVIQKQLTRNLPNLTPRIAAELGLGFKRAWGDVGAGWTRVKLWDSCMDIISSAANSAFCGDMLCRDLVFLKRMKHHTMAMFAGALIISCVPGSLKPFCGILVSWTCQLLSHRAMQRCMPFILDRLSHMKRRMSDPSYAWVPPDDGLQWIIEECYSSSNPEQLDPNRVWQRLLIMNDVSLLTTSFTVQNFILDLFTTDPSAGYVEILRKECAEALALSSGQWDAKSVGRLRLVDSALRESMRVSPVGPFMLPRTVMDPGGIKLDGCDTPAPPGTVFVLPVENMHFDERVYSNARCYNPFRFAHPEKHVDDKNTAAKQKLAVTLDESFFAFGTGRHACPGRFFAIVEIKIFIANMLLNYEVEYLDAKPPPRRVLWMKYPSSARALQRRKAMAYNGLYSSSGNNDIYSLRGYYVALGIKPSKPPKPPEPPELINPGSSAMATDSEPSSLDSTANAAAPEPPRPRIPALAVQVRFWGIFCALCLLAFISALDVAVITTALPTVTAEPLFGQLADAVGRRWPIVVSTALFAIGSGIAGGARNSAMLIAGRTVQGAGAGGIYVLLDIVCCDLVPMRERGKYLGLLFSWSGVAAALGPPVGGALAQSNWRWIFYLNIPICGVAVVVLLLFMHVGTGPASTHNRSTNTDEETKATHTGQAQVFSRLSRLDYLGSLIFIPSLVSLLIGLVMGGSDRDHPWSSWRIIVPIILGGVGWIVFHVQQFFTEKPSVPPRLFSNRTSAVGFVLSFTSSFVVQAISYFFAVYLQAVKGTTVLESGTFFLPFAIGLLATAVVSGILLSHFGAYRPLHAVSFALSALGFGLLAGLLDADTSKAVWVILELITAAGLGLIMSVLLPAIMAGLPESDVASSSATYSFIRTFGYIWGVTIPGIIFNAVFDSNIDHISDPSLREQLRGGAAYAFASRAHSLKSSIEASVWSQVTDVYTWSLRAIWWVCFGISVFSFLIVGIEKNLELRTDLDTDYGLQKDGNKPQGIEEAEKARRNEQL